MNKQDMPNQQKKVQEQAQNNNEVLERTDIQKETPGLKAKSAVRAGQVTFPF
ncbi:MAG: hypothetical protein AAF702_15870 [Chloroflexota bacterium]